MFKLLVVCVLVLVQGCGSTHKPPHINICRSFEPYVYSHDKFCVRKLDNFTISCDAVSIVDFCMHKDVLL